MEMGEVPVLFICMRDYGPDVYDITLAIPLLICRVYKLNIYWKYSTLGRNDLRKGRLHLDKNVRLKTFWHIVLLQWIEI